LSVALKYILIILFAGLLLVSCRVQQKPTGEEGESDITRMPVEMPRDFAFKVAYGIGAKNEINTFDHTATKDLVTKGTATATIVFTEDELRTIYERMKEMDIMENKLLVPEEKSCFQTPYGEDNWEIKAAGQTVVHSWSGEYCEVTDDARELIALRNYVADIVKGKMAYIELPEPVGGYD